MKKLLGLLVLGLAVWFMTELVPPQPNATPSTPVKWTSSQQCKECHQEVFAEWEDSWHARSWIDEDVIVQSDNFSNKVCIDCHAPRGVFETGVGNRVLPRSSRRAEGVDCLACHLLPNGGVAGTINMPSAPCKPEAILDLSRVSFCAGCHDQHKTVTQWRATPMADTGPDCLDCHMPFRDGNPNRGRHHGMAGGHDMTLVRSAVTLEAEREGPDILVTVENIMGAHAFPTDERSRAADIFWRPAQEDAAVRGGWTHLHRIRDPYRMEVDIPSTLLHALASQDKTGVSPRRTLRFTPGGGPIEVALFYKLAPYYRDPNDGRVWKTEEVTDPLMDSSLVHRVVVP